MGKKGAEALTSSAQEHLALGNLEEAVAAAEEALAAFPNHQVAREIRDRARAVLDQREKSEQDARARAEAQATAAREAAAKEQTDGPALRRVSLIVDAADADVMGDEPIWAKVNGKDFGTVGKTHDFGAPRFDKSGKEVRGSSAATGASAVRGLHDGEWSVVGWVTSGGYAHYVGKSMAQGYVPRELAENESEGLFEIEILGHRRPARINIEPPFDPSGDKMRG